MEGRIPEAHWRLSAALRSGPRRKGDYHPADLSAIRQNLPLKSVFCLPGNVGLQRKQTAGQSIAGQCPERGCRDVESLESIPAEGTIRDVRGGHFHNSVDRAAGRRADNALAAIAAIPQIAFAVDCGPIRSSPAEILQKGPRIFQFAVIKLEYVDAVRQRIAKVELRAIGTPDNRVRDANATPAFRRLAIRIDSIEPSIGASYFSR